MASRHDRWWKRQITRHTAQWRRKMVRAAGWANRRSIEAGGGRVSEELCIAASIARVSIPRSLRHLVERRSR